MSTALVAQVLAHLDAQIASARRLLGFVLAQGQAIRAREVEAVLQRLAEIRTEMAGRGRLEQERADLLTGAGAVLGIAGGAVTLEHLTSLMGAGEAALARSRSGELRGLLAEIVREHGINRALMRQELAFLDHLVRLMGAEPETGYEVGPQGPTVRGPGHAWPATHRVLNLQA